VSNEGDERGCAGALSAGVDLMYTTHAHAVYQVNIPEHGLGTKFLFKLLERDAPSGRPLSEREGSLVPSTGVVGCITFLWGVVYIILPLMMFCDISQIYVKMTFHKFSTVSSLRLRVSLRAKHGRCCLFNAMVLNLKEQ